MRPHSIISTLARTIRVRREIFLALRFIDTEHFVFIIANVDSLLFAILSGVMIQVFIAGGTAVTKHLVISIDILQPWNTLASIVALMICATARFVAPHAKHASKSSWACTMLPVSRRFDVHV
jgi:hypothetical protein